MITTTTSAPPRLQNRQRNSAGLVVGEQVLEAAWKRAFPEVPVVAPTPDVYNELLAGSVEGFCVEQGISDCRLVLGASE